MLPEYRAEYLLAVLGWLVLAGVFVSGMIRLARK